MVPGAERVTAAADLEPKRDGTVQRGDGAALRVTYADQTGPPQAGQVRVCGQPDGPIGLRTGTPAGHGETS